MEKTIKECCMEFLEDRYSKVSTGISILEMAGYDAAIVDYYRRNAEKNFIHNKLCYEVRILLRKNFQESPQKEVEVKKELPEDMPDVEVPEDKIENKEYPNEIKAVLYDFNDRYKRRSILHYELKNIGESNNEEDVKRRKVIIENIDALSEEMDKLWLKFGAYKQGLNLSEAEETDNIPESNEEKEDELSDLDMETLIKKKESVRVNIQRIKTQLEYQSFTKSDKPNPMPDCPRRIKMEKKLGRLLEDKNRLEFAIAKKM